MTFYRRRFQSGYQYCELLHREICELLTFERIAEHKGVSSRTGNELSSPIYSSIRDHCSKCGSGIIDCNFKLLKSSSSSNSEDLRIMESLYIRKLRPSLNETLSSFPLQIV